MTFLRRGVLALLLIVGVVACSDGDSGEEATEKESTTTTSTTVPALAVEEIDAEASPYCGAWAEIRAKGAPELTGDPEADAETRKEYYAGLVPLTEQLVEQADEEIKPAAQFALDQVRAVAETGSDEPFGSAEAADRQQELAAYAQEHCSKD